MRKYQIGFCVESVDKSEQTVKEPEKRTCVPRPSVVQVRFPNRGMSLAYYNDRFDLKVGDVVYVEGKLEGIKGRVEAVNYSFKIKISDYKRVINIVDTSVVGDLYLAGSHMVSFDRTVIPFSKILPWFKVPDDAEYVSGNDDSGAFPLDDLSKMNVEKSVAERGHDYYVENKVVYMEIDGVCGRAIVEGSEYYDIEFNFENGEISNLKCSCFCGGHCKHEFAAMLQLRGTLKLVSENYDKLNDGYFAIIDKCELVNTVMTKPTSGKISISSEL